MIEISFFVAFFSGLVSFFSPCVLPLIPTYISYVVGVSVEDLKQKKDTKIYNKLLLSSLFYTLGFSLIFILLGLISASAGSLIRQNGRLIQILGGIIMIVLGLQFAGLLEITFFSHSFSFKLPTWTKKLGYVRSFLLGIVFATTWSPCISAVLGSILVLSASLQTARQGAILLFSYSLGISLPFIIISLFFTTASRYLTWINKNIKVLSIIAGTFLSILGFMLVTNTYKYINFWLFAILK